MKGHMKRLLNSVAWSTGLGGLLSIFFLGTFGIQSLCVAHELMNEGIGNSYQRQIDPSALTTSGKLANNMFLGGAAPGMGGLTPTGGYPIQGDSVTLEDGIGGSDGGSANLLFGNERNGGVGANNLPTLDRSPNNQTVYSVWPNKRRFYSSARGKSSQNKLKRHCVNATFNQSACPFP